MASATSQRSASVSRKTKETAISVTVDIDGAGRFDIATGVGFFDHMLEQLSRHSLIDMTVKAKGDLHIDDHHTVEDTGIALGQAIAKAFGERRGITRYASIDLAMDETLTQCGGRCFGPSVPGLERRLLVAQGRHVRHRAGARILPGAEPACRHHAACRQSLWRQQSPYRRDLLQGGGAGAAHGAGARSAPGRRDTVDQGLAEGIGPMASWIVMEPAGSGQQRERSRCGLHPRRLLVRSPSCCRRSGCCGTGCGSRPRWRSRRWCWRPACRTLDRLRRCSALLWLLVSLFVGLEGNALRIAALSRRGWRELGRGRGRQSG